MALHGNKAAQDRPGVALKGVVAPDIEQLVHRLEVIVDRMWDRINREQVGMEILQQEYILLPDGLGRPIIALDQLLPGALLLVVDQPKTRGQLVLQVENQTVLAPRG